MLIFLLKFFYVLVHLEIVREGNSQHNHRVHSLEIEGKGGGSEEEGCFFLELVIIISSDLDVLSFKLLSCAHLATFFISSEHVWEFDAGIRMYWSSAYLLLTFSSKSGRNHHENSSS